MKHEIKPDGQIKPLISAAQTQQNFFPQTIHNSMMKLLTKNLMASNPNIIDFLAKSVRISQIQ